MLGGRACRTRTRARSASGNGVLADGDGGGVPLALCSRTDREPGTVSSESSSWVMFWLGERSDERANDAFTYAWRRMAVSRSCRMNCGP